MVGNSFIDANNMEYMVEQMLREGNKGVDDDVYAMRFDQGSSRFAEHVKESVLQDMILERAWNWVVLQEQSEIPGFWGTYYEPTFDLSMQSLETLDDWVRRAQADTVLLMTWARVGADPYYPDLFPNFERMQAKIMEGYIRMQQHISTSERPVPIAPVGLAFQYIRDHANTTDFAALYAEDTIHPSVLGSYVAACTVYATLTPIGYPPLTHIQFGPPGLKTGIKHRLQEAAQAAALQFNNENPINRQYYEMKRTANKKPYPEEPASDDTAAARKKTSVVWVGGSILLVVMTLWIWNRQHKQTIGDSGRHQVLSTQDNDDIIIMHRSDSVEMVGFPEN